MIRTGIATAAALAIVLFAIRFLPLVPPHLELPVGCDAFGYHRQADLFRQNGLAGFDTRLETPSARKIIDGVKDLPWEQRNLY